MLKNLFLLIILLLDTGLIYSQENKNYQLPSIAAGGGVFAFYGDISHRFLNKISGGYHFSAEQNLGKNMAVSFRGISGKLKDRNTNPSSATNFQSNIFQGDLSISVHLNKPTTPYLSVGFGFLKFDSYTDKLDANGAQYYYWSDGSIKDTPENASASDRGNAKNLILDYKYETKLTDSINNYHRYGYILPVSIGANIRIFERVSLKADATYYTAFTDWIDNTKKGNNTDSYFYGSLSLVYHISRFKYDDDNSEVFQKIESDDEDADGVSDLNDLCPHTPKEAKVDPKGCPIDSDNDGIADYLDQEPHSAKGAIVNENGVTLTDEMIKKRYNDLNQLADGTSDSYKEEAAEKMKVDSLDNYHEPNSTAEETTPPLPKLEERKKVTQITPEEPKKVETAGKTTTVNLPPAVTETLPKEIKGTPVSTPTLSTSTPSTTTVAQTQKADSVVVKKQSKPQVTARPSMKPKEEFKRVSKDDWDGDGVDDIDDMCPYTPKEAKVDKKGCPIDSDDDGVADYLDKEPETIKGAIVDKYGVTLTDDVIAKKHNELNLLAEGKLNSYRKEEEDKMRVDSLNNYREPQEIQSPKAQLPLKTKEPEIMVPETAEAPKKTEVAPPQKDIKTVPIQAAQKSNTAEAVAVTKTETKKTTIPQDLKAFDANKDGVLSSDEITKAIDGLKKYIKAEKGSDNATEKSSSKIPLDLMYFDYDKNGNISSNEIQKAIDDFFDDDENITIVKLNELVDYYFEQ